MYLLGIYGACADLLDRNVVAPGQYSKRFLRPNPALSRYFSAANRPGNTCQVCPGRFLDSQSYGRHQPFNWAALAISRLHNQRAAETQEQGGLRDQDAIGRKPVSAAVQCEMRIMLAHLCRKTRDVGNADIGRV